MIKISHTREVQATNHLPLEVSAKVLEIATILDDNYGVTRDEHYDLGGYILIVEDEKDVDRIKELMDFKFTLPEYVDLIACKNGKENYTNSLILLSSDFSISLIIPMSSTPKELLKYLKE